MYLSEDIQNKWAPVLDCDSVGAIKDTHRRSVTALVLENTEKALREDAAHGNYQTLTEANPAATNIMGASSSRNPLASVGASREMKLALAYELPFILVVITVIIKSGGIIKIGDIINYQINFGSSLASFSGAIAFVVSLLCMQAKLGLVPFDIAEAEQEIMAGTLIEYSGMPLAVFKLTKAVLLYTMPLLIISLFWAKDTSLISITLKYVLLLVIIILIKNTNPRVKIDQAIKFFWGPLTILAVLAVILALIGL